MSANAQVTIRGLLMSTPLVVVLLLLVNAAGLGLAGTYFLCGLVIAIVGGLTKIGSA